MTIDERASALGHFGYTQRQARFLTLAAMHSGYFLRRQYVTFTGRRHGATTVEFLHRAVERGHVAVITAPVIGRVYHVAARALYASVDDVDNRNRRLHGASSIRRRLMALDYVLARAERMFLTTEREKVAYFAGEHRVPSSVLPAVVYTSKDGRSTTTRCFVEKLPIAHGPSGVAFAYIDDDDATVGGFASFLERHRALLAALRVPTQVVFVTTAPHHAPRAQSFFARMLGERATRIPLAVSTLGAYVHARLRLEQGTLRGLPQHELDALRRSLAAVPGATGDTLYRRWGAKVTPH
jgi:hypothetical protein